MWRSLTGALFCFCGSFPGYLILALAINTPSKILTNDFNLNRVAELQKVLVLNINILSREIHSICLLGSER